MKNLVMVLLALLSIAYLLNPGMGVLDIIPDNLPIVGNLDEAAATALLLSCLAYFGIDLTNFFKREEKKKEEDVQSEPPRAVEGKVVDD